MKKKINSSLHNLLHNGQTVLGPTKLTPCVHNRCCKPMRASQPTQVWETWADESLDWLECGDQGSIHLPPWNDS